MPGKSSQHALETLLILNANSADTSQHRVEILYVRPTPSPTSITGSGVSQHVLEVLFSVNPNVHVHQHVIEVLGTLTELAGGAAPAAAGAYSFAYVS